MSTSDPVSNASETEIISKDQLIAYMQSGCKSRNQWRIGTEHEKFGFIRGRNRPLPYLGDASISTLLNQLHERFGWQAIMEDEHIIGLKKGGASVSLEPGGQFELSGAPLEHIHQTCAEVGEHLNQLRGIADEMHVGFLGLGFSPVWRLDETPVMPKARYKIMRDYMPEVGRLGHQMMFRSCTVQTNLDFEDETDMRQKFRLALALQPLATALFANSPFADGRLNGFLSYRAHIWTDTDPDRTGTLPFVFEEGFGFERYVDYALDVPMYFVKRDDRLLNCAGQSFRDFMHGKLAILSGERPNISDWEDHLSTLFPEVRLKTFLEMRGADSGPWNRLCALPALWVGLLYDGDSQSAAWDLVKGWSAAERESIYRTAPFMGLRTPIPGGGNLQSLAKEVLQIAYTGLNNRACINHSGDDETGFLSELLEIAHSGVSPAEQLIHRYKEDWHGDLSAIFEACAY